MVRYFRDGMQSIIGSGLDLVFCNESEALEYAESQDLEAAKARLRDCCKGFVITRGPKGALLFDGDKEIEIPGRIVDAKDTNGAGDLFAGAFLRSIAGGSTFEEAGRLAILASSVLVTQFGARLRPEQASDILKQNA